MYIYEHPLLSSIIPIIGLALAIGYATMLRCLPGIMGSNFRQFRTEAERARAGGRAGGRTDGPDDRNCLWLWLCQSTSWTPRSSSLWAQ